MLYASKISTLIEIYIYVNDMLMAKKHLEFTGEIVIFAVGQQDTASSESVDSKA